MYTLIRHNFWRKSIETDLNFQTGKNLACEQNIIKSASTKLVTQIKKEVSKRRKPIQKDALAISKEMSNRKSQNAKRQGRLIWN